MIQLSELTVEQLQVRVTAPVDPTGGPVNWAFAPKGTAPVTWEPGVWHGSPALAAGGYRAVTLSPTIGAAGATVPLSPGEYDVWVQADAGGETPVRLVDAVRIRAAA